MLLCVCVDGWVVVVVMVMKEQGTVRVKGCITH